MRIVVTLEVEVERVEGKFESRESLENAVLEAVESANDGTIEGENGGTYEITGWDVTVEDVKPARKVKFTPAPPADPTATCNTCDATALTAFPTDRHGVRVFGKCRACKKAGK